MTDISERHLTTDKVGEGDKYYEFFETFDSAKLNVIIQYYKYFAEKYWFQYDEAELTRFKTYLRCSINNEIQVTYRQKRGTGRLWAVGTKGLQNILRVVRHTISGEFYNDIDIVNSGASIIINICRLAGLPENETKNLQDYIDNREAHLNVTVPETFLTYYCERKKIKFTSDLKLTRDDIKAIYIEVYNGAVYRSKLNNFFADFQAELNRIRKAVANSDYYAKEFHEFTKLINNKSLEKDDETEGLTINDKQYSLFLTRLIYKYENGIIQKIHKFLGSPTNCVFTFDGIQVLKSVKYNEEELQAYITNTLGLNIKLKTKPMNEGIKELQNGIGADLNPEYKQFWELNNVTPFTYPSLRFYNDYFNITGERFVISEYVVKHWIKNCIGTIINGKSTKFVVLQYEYDEAEQCHGNMIALKHKEDFYNDLDKECYIINTRYDKDFTDLFKHLSEENENKKLAKKNPCYGRFLYENLGEYLKRLNKINQIPHYNKITFAPHLKHQKIELGGNFNQFVMFEMEKMEPCPEIDFEKSQTYRLITEVLCNNNVLEYTHLLDTIADMFQDAFHPKPNAHLFYSEPGVGKDTFCRFLSRMLGSTYSTMITDIDYFLTSPFNSNTCMKLLRVFQEVSESGHHINKHERLKQKIDARREEFTLKGVDKIDVNNCARAILLTNNKNAIHIERGNRRYTLHECNNKYARNKEFFAPILAEIANDRFIKASFDYFCTRKITSNVHDICETKYGEELKINSLPAPIKFMKEFIELKFNDLKLHADYDGKDIKKGKKGDMHFRVRQTELFAKYKETFGGNSPNAMKLKLSEFNINPRTARPADGGGSVMIYELYPPEIEKIFKEKLAMPNFSFNYSSEEQDAADKKLYEEKRAEELAASDGGIKDIPL